MGVDEHAIDLIPMLQQVRVPAGIVDRRGVFTWENEAARAAVGDLLGRPLTSVVAAEDVPKVEQQLGTQFRATTEPSTPPWSGSWPSALDRRPSSSPPRAMWAA